MSSFCCKFKRWKDDDTRKRTHSGEEKGTTKLKESDEIKSSKPDVSPVEGDAEDTKSTTSVEVSSKDESLTPQEDDRKLNKKNRSSGDQRKSAKVGKSSAIKSESFSSSTTSTSSSSSDSSSSSSSVAVHRITAGDNPGMIAQRHSVQEPDSFIKPSSQYTAPAKKPGPYFAGDDRRQNSQSHPVYTNKDQGKSDKYGKPSATSRNVIIERKILSRSSSSSSDSSSSSSTVAVHRITAGDNPGMIAQRHSVQEPDSFVKPSPARKAGLNFGGAMPNVMVEMRAKLQATGRYVPRQPAEEDTKVASSRQPYPALKQNPKNSYKCYKEEEEIGGLTPLPSNLNKELDHVLPCVTRDRPSRGARLPSRYTVTSNN